MDVLFIISHNPDNRYEKRLSIISEYFKTGIIYWNKAPDSYSFKMNGVLSCEIHKEANRTNPLKRIPQTISFIIESFKKVSELKPQCLYVGNLDMLLVAYLYKSFNKHTSIIYEIADLHRLIIDEQKGKTKKVLSYTLKTLEKILTKKVDKLVLTSMKFYDVYYYNLVNKNNVIFMPNMPDQNTFNGFLKNSHNDFTVGFIGWIRYKDQLRMLIQAAIKANVKVLFAGEDGDGNSFEQECSKYKHVEFLGKFNYSTEIQKMYQKVDCIYAVYNADMANVRVALPNKLYEAILCETPIIVAKNTYLSELVKEMGVGVSVSHKNENDLVSILQKLSKNKDFYNSICKKCKDNMDKINLSNYNTKLIDSISDLLKVRS